MVYDRLLELAGVGPFHYQLLLLCGWANAADAVEILAASFIIYSAQTTLQLSDSEKGWIGAMVFFGMLAGGWVWGSLADRLGRRLCLILALLLNSVGGVLAAFAPSYHAMLLCRFIAGLGVGGSIPVIFTYFIEFLPTSRRGAWMVYLAWFWMVGAIFTAASAWSLLTIRGMENATFIITPFQPWRLFTLVCALPSLLCAVLLLFCPESPRFLLTMRRAAEARVILANIFAINHPESDAAQGRSKAAASCCGLCCLDRRRLRLSLQEEYSVIGQDEADSMVERKEEREEEEQQEAEERKEEATEQKQLSPAELQRLFDRELAGLTLGDSDKDEAAAAPRLTLASFMSELAGIADKTRVLFTGRNLPHSLKLSIVWFGLSFGYYGITLWIPETFSHLNPEQDSAVLNVYAAAFVSALTNLPGNVLSVYTVRSLGRTVTLASSIFASCLATLLVPFASSALSVTLVLSAFTLVSVGAWNALNISTTELYDTQVRSTAFGVLAAVGRMGAILGNVLFGEFIGVGVGVPMAVTGGFLLCSALAAWRLKETKDEVLT